ncbi:MAG: hypothetical protein JNM88_12280 [Chitinophagaceae bacterium]|nr:hypothetical protein [Chitinophagaceae bacterium]
MSIYKSAADQWGIPSGSDNGQKPPENNNTPADPGSIQGNADVKTNTVAGDTPFAESLKRRGFFEAISTVKCPVETLEIIRREYSLEAEKRLAEIDSIAAIRLNHIEETITFLNRRLQEIKHELAVAKAYCEEDDRVLQKLIAEKWQKEQELLALEKRLTETRIRLGEAKAGIINKSLDEAEIQIKKALNIQETIYKESFRISKQKFEDEKDHLAKMAECYQQLYDHYKTRYEKVKKVLTIMDVDGISPVTTNALRSIAGTSFIAAGFFFSTFAAATGFGNKDLLYFILGGVLNTADQDIAGVWKVLILLGLIGLITGISWLSYRLIKTLKRKSDEEIISEILLGAAISKRVDKLDYKANIKSNNWYAFWLQLVPFILIIGLVALCVAYKASDENLNSLNASSEGLIVGAFVALALAGLIYLYVIKIVEPRLVHKQENNNGKYVNWVWANRELAFTLVAFLIFTICIIVIPYNTTNGQQLIPIDQSTRYAILLFIGMSLVGGVTFAYGVRSQGLIDTSRFLERVMFRLNSAIAVCTAPEAPALPDEIKDRDKNIVQHVLKQFSFNAAVNKTKLAKRKKREGDTNPFAWLIKKITWKKNPEPATEPFQSIIAMEPWEERYFPHIVEELKALEFEYREQKARTGKAEQELASYREKKNTELRKYEMQLAACETDIATTQARRATVKKEQADDRIAMNQLLKTSMNDILDGFHLGIWYRENNIGPTVVYYQSCADNDPGGDYPILLPESIKQ